MKNDFDKLSLKKVDVTGNIIGKFSIFGIQQEYTNETATTLEVTYTFPISSSATITAFTATIGDKIIKGKVQEKEQAQKEYEKAMAKGDSAYMMTYDESNIFRMNIGKIAVNETVKIRIDYIDNLEIIDSQIRMIIPTLVLPRYKSEITEKLNYAEDEIEYRGNITISLDEGLKIDDVESKTHSIKLEGSKITAKNIKLDKDFVLDIKLSEQAFSKGYYHELPNGKKAVYLSFFPDIEIENINTPKNYIFIMDISRSMSGYKLKQTKEAVIKCLKQLRNGDKFMLLFFNNKTSKFRFYKDDVSRLVEFNEASLKKAEKDIKSIQANGGTELLSPIKEALSNYYGTGNNIFLFTDGAVGNESEIADYVRQNINKNSIFVFGIDSSINKNGLQEIADAGRGKAEFIVRDEDIKEIIFRQFARVSSANLFEVELNCKLNRITDKIEKQRVLFNHEFYDILLEVDDMVDDFELQCKTDTQTYSFTVSKDRLEHFELLDKIYAAEQIKTVEKYIARNPYSENKGYKERIVEIAVEHQIASKYTAFIAVNERDKKLSDIPVLQDIGLNFPAGSGWEAFTVTASCLSRRSGAPENIHRKFRHRIKASSTIYNFELGTSAEDSKKPLADKEIKVMVKDTLSKLLSKSSSQITTILQKIKVCERRIIEKKSYQKLLDKIIEELKLLSLDECEELAKRIERETPQIYALVKPYLVQ